MTLWRPFLILRLGILAACAALIVISAVPVVRHMAGIVLVAHQPLPPLPRQAPATAIDLAPIFALAPFGRPPVANQPPDSTGQSRPDLRLKGIFAAASEGSVALIEVAQETALYRPDQIVTDGYRLTRIGAAFVELSDRQNTITLSFDDTRMADAETEPAVSEDLSAQINDQIRASLVVPARFEQPAAPETTSEYIDYWRTRIRKNPQAVLDEIGLTPTENGYVIAAKHDVGVRLAGLKAGDLVRRVNGQPVGNPDEDRRFYDRIATSGQARLEIERGGKTLTLSFPLR